MARQFQAADEPAFAAHAYADAARYALSVFANDDARAAASAGLALAADDVVLRYDLLATREHALRDGSVRRRSGATMRGPLVAAAGDDDERRGAALARMFEAYRDDAEVRAEALREPRRASGPQRTGSGGLRSHVCDARVP